MKLLNQSLKFLSVSIFLIIGIWSVIFYFNLLDEIKESIDEGLENYKRQIIYQQQGDSAIAEKKNFDDGFFTIREIQASEALKAKDYFIDTVMYMQDADDKRREPEPVRMLITAFHKDNRYYELRIANSMVEEDDLIEELLWKAAWLYFILVAGIVFINNFLLKRLWDPFYQLLNHLKIYRLGSNSTLPGFKTGTKEFIDLQNAVNTLLKRNNEVYEQQKQFIGNASHELQTPIAIITNKLELLLEKEDLKTTQAEKISEVLEIVERMTRLNKSLLLLSKIGNKQFLEIQEVSINEITDLSIHELEEIAEYKNVMFIKKAAAEVRVQMDPTLAHIVISNLLKNAVYHNQPGGLASVEILENEFRITNTGIASGLDPDRIFTRFYKSGSAESGTGLGLAIVKAICDVYGFKIAYAFNDGKHSFELNFLN